MEKIEFMELLLELSKEKNRTKKESQDMQNFNDEHKRLYEENEKNMAEATKKQEQERQEKEQQYQSNLLLTNSSVGSVMLI